MGNFQSWDSLGRERLQACASLIASLPDDWIKQEIIADVESMSPILKIDTSRLELTPTSLLGVPSSYISVFLKNPIGSDDDVIEGLARFIRVNDEILPFILLSPNRSVSTEKHEAIHICQWLQPDPYPMTSKELVNALPKPLDRVLIERSADHPMSTLDFLIRFVCYKTWIELEAYHFAHGMDGISPWECLDFTQRSARPFETFEGAIEMIDLEDRNQGMVSCRNRFREFCLEIQADVPWVKGLLDEICSDSLETSLFSFWEEQQIDMLCGPLDGDENEIYPSDPFEGLDEPPKRDL